MNSVIDFWFNTLKPADWYKKSDELDARIKKLFIQTYRQIVAGETSHWRDVPDGRLAEIIVLDQFTRNMFRGTPESFNSDPLALALAQEAVRCGSDQNFEDTKRSFIYMPYMHSESRVVHEQAIELFKDLPGLEYEIKHKEIIDQFGRYPHRNDILGRVSTAEEIFWMKENKGF